VVVGDLWFQVTEDKLNHFNFQFLLGATKTASPRQTLPQGAPFDDVIQVQAVSYLLLYLISNSISLGGHSKKEKKFKFSSWRQRPSTRKKNHHPNLPH